MVNGSRDFMHSQKLKSLKRDLITWNREVFSKVSTQTEKSFGRDFSSSRGHRKECIDSSLKEKTIAIKNRDPTFS